MVISASIFLAVVAGMLLWHQIHAWLHEAGLHDAAVQVADLRNAAVTIDSVPVPLKESTENPQAPGDPAQLDDDGQRRRLNKFSLERYYPDLQKEAGFDPDDVDKLLQLMGSDETELEKGLGAAKYQRWKEYEARVQAGDAVSRLGRSLSGDDQLRDDQAEMLSRAIFDERRRRDEELRMHTYAAPSDLRSRVELEFGSLEIMEQSDRRLLAAAKPLLSEQQFAALPEAIVDSNLATRREELERVRARVENRSAQ